jgi:hypothetical protein
MGVSHRSLSGSEVHEPKDIEQAAADQVYAAVGIGNTGRWVAVDDISSIMAPAYISMVATNNTNTFLLNSTTDTQIIGFQEGSATAGGLSYSNDGINVNETGVYLYTAVATVAPSGLGLGTSNETVTLRLYVDDQPLSDVFSQSGIITRNADAGQQHLFSNSQLIQITAGGRITLYANTPDSDREYIVPTASITLVKVADT